MTLVPQCVPVAKGRGAFAPRPSGISLLDLRERLFILPRDGRCHDCVRGPSILDLPIQRTDARCDGGYPVPQVGIDQCSQDHLVHGAHLAADDINGVPVGCREGIDSQGEKVLLSLSPRFLRRVLVVLSIDHGVSRGFANVR